MICFIPVNGLFREFVGLHSRLSLRTIRFKVCRFLAEEMVKVMSRHVWLVRPNSEKAVELWEAFEYAVDQGCDSKLAATFAGYFLERKRQSGSSGHTPALIFVKARGLQFRFANGKNSNNYLLAFCRHWGWFLSWHLAQAAGLESEAPWQVVYDKLREEQSHGLADLLRMMAEVNGQWEI